MKNGITGEIYNVGSGKPEKIECVLNQILKEEEISKNVVKTNCKPNMKYDVKTIFANINKLKKLG